jgi:hypothetical protein
MSPRPRKANLADQGAKSGVPGISAEVALSFLKDTKGVVSWTIGELVGVLKIGNREAEQVVALLEAQGYVARAEKGAWLTTAAGESVAGAKTPRFSRESVGEAVESLKERIKEVNKDKNARFKIAQAVAFGDFLLTGRAKVQAADVGIRLAARGATGELKSASDAKAENKFLRELRGKAQMLNLRPYAEWMSKRSHSNLEVARPA